MTSIKWLIEQLQAPCRGIPTHIIDKANEMHQEEVEDAFHAGKWDWAEHIINDTESKDQAQYYQETFKKQIT